jgi:cytochrome c biogenesis protein CcmG, thiol:disulfide interchange protein DsbE
MKKFFAILSLLTLAPLASLVAQNQTIPEIALKALDGSTVNSSTFSNEGKPMVISLWATWCKPCIQELMAIQDVYEEWQEATGVKIIAIAVDDARSSGKVAPFVNSKDWEYEVYIDENQDFQRAMNVANVPYTVLINGKGEIVWEHNSYVAGDEEHLLEKIKELTESKPEELH